jgi:hypothetical protein
MTIIAQSLTAMGGTVSTLVRAASPASMVTSFVAERQAAVVRAPEVLAQRNQPMTTEPLKPQDFRVAGVGAMDLKGNGLQSTQQSRFPLAKKQGQSMSAVSPE